MKVRPSVKRMCEHCKVIRRRGVVRVICTNPRHKQGRGFARDVLLHNSKTRPHARSTRWTNHPAGVNNTTQRESKAAGN